MLMSETRTARKECKEEKRRIEGRSGTGGAGAWPNNASRLPIVLLKP